MDREIACPLQNMMLQKSDVSHRRGYRRKLVLSLTFLAMLVAGFCFEREANGQQVQWIWTSDHRPKEIPQASCFFRKSFRMLEPELGQLQIAANDRCEVYLNGSFLGTAEGSEHTKRFDISSSLVAGVNVLAVQVDNTSGTTAGLAAAIVVKEKSEDKWRMLPTGEAWNASTERHQDWTTKEHDDSSWGKCQIVQTSKSATTPPATNAAAAQSLRSASDQPQVPTDDLTNRPVGPIATRETATAEEPAKYSIAADFSVKTVVDSSIGSLIAMEFDEWGRLICSLEAGGLVRVDFKVAADQPGRIKTICEKVSGCQGILSLNGNLYVTGQGPDGLALYRLTDANSDGTMEQITTLLKFTGTVGEHGPHGVTLGPDGYLYVIIGNASGIADKSTAPSPYATTYEANIVPRIEDPGGHAVGVKAPGGTIARCRLDGTDVAIYAGGIRNAYDLAFDNNGELFIHDSDMETDIGTGWYRPTTVFQVQAGAEIGWRSGWASFGTHQPDCIAPIADTGRGSPTGVVVYNHLAFPQRFHNSLFLGDWSEGRILNVSLRETGGTYTTKTEVFLQSRPLNVTDLAVGPDGGLYFCTGGRGTAGGIFRINWLGETPSQVMNPESPTLKLLTFPQPQSAWGRQSLAKLKKQMGDEWKSTLETAVSDQNLDAPLRVRALEVLTLYGPTPSMQLLRSAVADPDARVRGRAAKLMGMRKREDVESDLIALLQDTNPWVRRVTCESLVRVGSQPTLQQITQCLKSTDRSEAFAARRLLETMPVDQWCDEALRSNDIRVVIQSSLALTIAHPSTENGYKILARTAELLDGFISDADFLDLLRAVQLALTQGQIGPEKIPAFVERMAEEFPCKNAAINGELAKVLAYLKAGGASRDYAEYFIESADSLQQKLYAAMMLHSMAEKLEPADRRAILLTIERALAVQGAGGGYYAYLSGAAESLARLITKDEVELVLERGNEWPHAMVAAFYLLPEKLPTHIAERLIQIDKTPTQRTDAATRKMRAGILALLAGCDDAATRSYLHTVWQNEELRRNDVALVLAQRPEGENWAYLVSSFPNLDPDTAGEVLMKLREVKRRPREGKQYRELIQLGLRLKDSGAIATVALLEHWTQQTLGSGEVDWQTAIQLWKNWFAQEFPEEAPISASADPRQSTRWTATELINAMAALDSPADVSRGQRLFSTAQCAKCHRYGTTGDALGPDLTALAGRFTRVDMIEAIVHPSKIVSDQYRGKKITTRNGQTMNGLLTIGPDDSWIVLNSSGDRISIPISEVEEIGELNQSTMPDGLLDKLSAQEVADLIYFLQSDAKGQVAGVPATSPNIIR